MKSLFLFSVCITMFLSLVNPCFAKESPFIPQNTQLYSEYLEQLNVINKNLQD